MATGQLPDAEADRAGLVKTHAYAVLNVVEVKVCVCVCVTVYLYVCVCV